MKLRIAKPGARAFTMIEIAIALGVIAFALVAIMGVLPLGLKVQRENREETTVLLDGTYFLEAIRGGARGMDDLTNYVDLITISNATGPLPRFTNYLNQPGAKWACTNGFQIVGLLSTPKFPDLRSFPNAGVTVSARVRAIAGSAAMRKTRNPTNDPSSMAFTYLMTTEIIPAASFVPDQTNFNSGGG